jgi:hypothetical protein
MTCMHMMPIPNIFRKPQCRPFSTMGFSSANEPAVLRTRSQASTSRSFSFKQSEPPPISFDIKQPLQLI